MAGKNVSFVVGENEYAGFLLETNAPVSADRELHEDVILAYKRFTTAFDDLLTVTGLELEFKKRDTAAEVLDESQSDTYYEEAKQSFQDDSGITPTEVEQYVSSLAVPDGYEVYISRFKSTATRVQIYLEDGYHGIDQHRPDVHKYQSRSGDYVDGGASVITFTFGYSPHGSIPEEEQASCFIGIKTDIDIWFGDSLLERINGARIGECVDQLDEYLGIREVTINYPEITGVGRSDIESLVEYDGPPAAELIEQFQTEWIEETFVQSADIQTCDGRQTLQIEGDPGRLDVETIASYLETALLATVPSDPAARPDRIEVETDEWTLAGALQSDSVVWD